METAEKIDIESLRLPDKFIYTKKNLYSSTYGIHTEKEATETLKDFLVSQNWQFREQYRTKTGKLIDFLVKAPYQDGYIFFGVECKRRINDETHATELADYMEQACFYSRELNLPVFVGPVLSHKRGHELCKGGDELRSIAALNIFGGRLNVGTIVRSVCINNYRPIKWQMVLRGAMFWTEEYGFNPERLQMVCSDGSNLQRKQMKIWIPEQIKTE